ncbi:MAG: hypothetical protein R3B49_02100 [Phycisphaerales bacterium]
MTRETRETQKTRRAFTLTELAAIVVVALVGAAAFVPAAGAGRRGAQAYGSEQNLREIWVASAVYMWANDALLPAYSWQAGVQYQVAGDSIPKSYSTQSQAQEAQNVDILRRLTGRDSGQDVIKHLSRTTVAHRRYSHLVVADWMSWSANAPVFASPRHENLLRWQGDPLDLSTVPYAHGVPSGGYETDPNWQKPGELQRWGYSSSYLWAPVSWLPDYAPTYGPVSSTPHLFVSTGSFDFPLGGRRLNEVRHPAHKVFVLEEFDWQAGTTDDRWPVDGVYFAYPEARCAKLMFDGSVNRWASGRANPSWTPDNPQLNWKQRYVPLDQYPAWPYGDPNDVHSMSFYWTRYGLQGVDYPPVDTDPRANEPGRMDP